MSASCGAPTNSATGSYLPLVEQDGVVAVAEIGLGTTQKLGALRGYDGATGDVVWESDLAQFDAPVTTLPWVYHDLVLIEGTTNGAQTL